MGLQVALNKIVPFSEARSGLSKLVEQVAKDKYIVISKQNKQKAVLLDVNYFEYLQNEAEKEQMRVLEDELSGGFSDYINKAGSGKVVDEAEAYRLLTGKKLAWSN